MTCANLGAALSAEAGIVLSCSLQGGACACAGGETQAVANGYLPQLDAALLQELVERFNAHVRLEEDEFLPFAQQVLAREAEDMAMLGLALHRRHEAEEIMATAVVYGAT